MSDPTVAQSAPPSQLAASQTHPHPIPNILPSGSICTLSGATGVGKTALIATWVRAFLDGQPINGHATFQPTAIGVLVSDRPWASHRQWFDAAGVADRIVHHSLRDDPRFPWQDLRLWPRVPELFKAALDRLALPPGALLIVDPLALWLPGKVNDYKDMAIGLGVLGRILTERQLTTLAIFHQSKQLADRNQQYLRPQDRILGSTAQLGFSDTAMYLTSPEELGTSYYGLGWVPHNAKSEVHKLTRDAWGLFLPYRDYDDRHVLEAICELVPSHEQTGVSTAVLVKVIEVKLQIPERTAKRYLSTLLHEGRVEQPMRGRWRKKPPS